MRVSGPANEAMAPLSPAVQLLIVMRAWRRDGSPSRDRRAPMAPVTACAPTAPPAVSSVNPAAALRVASGLGTGRARQPPRAVGSGQDAR
jgi:hypothetical protein